MNQSFYTAALGVGSEQYKLDILANNTANLNTWGYKTKVPIFSELMYYEMKGKVQEDSELLTGTGMRIQKADTDFSQMTLAESEGDYHYAIEGDGMFMLRDPATNRITFSRTGRKAAQRDAGDVQCGSCRADDESDRGSESLQLCAADGTDIR